MKKALSILAILTHAFCFAQPNLDLTEKNIKRLFNLKPDVCCIPLPSEWMTCFRSDNSYTSADTITLFNDQYYGLSMTGCCYTTTWTFNTSTTIFITNANVCLEPPISYSETNNSGLKLKFKKVDGSQILSIYKGKVLKDKFRIFALDYVEYNPGKFVYRLSMSRQSIH